MSPSFPQVSVPKFLPKFPFEALREWPKVLNDKPLLLRLGQDGPRRILIHAQNLQAAIVFALVCRPNITAFMNSRGGKYPCATT